MKRKRNTIAKAEILKCLETSQTALSHAEIQVLLEGLCDRVTIYRVLDRLLEEGFIHKISNIDGKVKYAFCYKCTSEDHHHNHIHFSCEVCNSITCLEEIKPSFQLPERYKAKEVNFTVSGVCPNCI